MVGPEVVAPTFSDPYSQFGLKFLKYFEIKNLKFL